MMLVMSVIALFVLVSCEESKDVSTTKTEGVEGARSAERHKRPCNDKGRSKQRRFVPKW